MEVTIKVRDMAGLLLSDDLIFTSRVTATARAHGIEVTAHHDAAALLRQAKAKPPTCVLVDLQNPGLDIFALAAELKSANAPTIVGYGSHVDAESLKKARLAGCDVVLPRSKFVESLETELAGWLTKNENGRPDHGSPKS